MTVNSWYFESENRFQIPLGILQPPFFSLDYPMSAQYGSVGRIIAHELAHGFDSGSILFNADGRKSNWMDKQSYAKYNNMTNCMIQQYDNFPYHHRGHVTQRDDFADNSAVRTSYNAFLAEQALYGSQPRLPHEQLKDFDHKQLFFISIAQTWCTPGPVMPPGGDGHSPKKLRVMGSLQNFRAFQAAFNCPIGSDYAPREHCEIWASELKTEF